MQGNFWGKTHGKEDPVAAEAAVEAEDLVAAAEEVVVEEPGAGAAAADENDL